MKYKNRGGQAKFVRASKLYSRGKEIEDLYLAYLRNFFITPNIYYSECKQEMNSKALWLRDIQKWYAICKEYKNSRILIICILSTFYLISRVLRSGRSGVSFCQRLYSLWKIHFVLTLRSNWMFCSCVSTWVRCSCRGRGTKERGRGGGEGRVDR